MFQSTLSNCFLSCQSVRSTDIFWRKERYLTIPIRCFASFWCTTAKHLDEISKWNTNIRLFITLSKQSLCLLL